MEGYQIERSVAYKILKFHMLAEGVEWYQMKRSVAYRILKFHMLAEGWTGIKLSAL